MTTAPARPASLDRLRELVRGEIDDLVEIRRDLHAHPELGYEEERTSGVIRRELAALGMKFEAGLAGGTGVLGHLPGGASRAVGLRADIDALPIEELNDLPYKSTHKGRMHACGHDGHTTILLGAARVLARLAVEDELPRPVTFLFQPAEEGGGGGQRMVEDGALDGSRLGPPVENMFGLHGWPQLPLGHLATRPGPLLAAADMFEISLRGRGCHAAFPHVGSDAIVAGSAIVQALQTIVSRTTAPTEPAVVSVTKFHGGTAHNVIPETVTLGGTVRTLATETQDLVRRRLEEIATSIARAHGVEAELTYRVGYPVTLNDEGAAETVGEVARDAFGSDRMHGIDRPYMGAEDFSYYCHEVPSCFFLLGLRSDGETEMPGLHHPRFNFNDDAIATGVEMFCRLALRAAS